MQPPHQLRRAYGCIWNKGSVALVSHRNVVGPYHFMYIVLKTNFTRQGLQLQMICENGIGQRSHSMTSSWEHIGQRRLLSS